MILILLYTTYKTGSKGFKAMKKETAPSSAPKLSAIPASLANSVEGIEYKRLDQNDDSEDSITRMEQASNLLQSDSSGEDDDEEQKAGKIQVVNPQISDKQKEIASQALQEKELQKMGSDSILAKPASEDFESMELKRLLADERTFFPYFKFFGLACNWLLIFVLSLIRGGVHGTPSVIGISVCSAAYWFYYVLPIPLILGFVCIAVAYLLIKNNRKSQLGHKFMEGELKWDTKTLLIATNMCLLAGVSSSFLGIGAGTLIAPILLEMGMNGTVSSATTSFMVLLSSSVTSLQYFVLGKVPLDYG